MELIIALVMITGLIWGVALDHLYIKYLVKKKKRVPWFLKELGVEIKKDGAE
ncbi:hypothetical protein ES703_71852 [subsurface metagenome]